MPLKLIPPRKGWSPNWRIRGTYLGQRVDQTTGTSDRKLATRALHKIRNDIEQGIFAPRSAPSFASAALRYIEAGGEDRFILRLAEHFGNRPLTSINQEAIDEAANTLYPQATPATRNRQVYTPVSAVLKRAGVTDHLHRPRDGRGKQRLFWFSPEAAGKLLASAYSIDREFGLFCTFLLYTGCRLSETLNLDVSDVNLRENWAYIRETKNGESRLVHLPPALSRWLAVHPRSLSGRQGKVWRFSKSGRLYSLLDNAARRAGVHIPDRVAFHIFRHTWGAWMRRYGGLDTTGLVETGAWRSRQAAAVYEHAVQSEEARCADLLPDVTKIKE